MDKSSSSERSSLLVVSRAKTNVRDDRTGRAAAADTHAPNKNARDGPETISVWLRLRSAQVANSVPLTMLLSRGVRMLQLLVFAYF